LPDVIYPLSSTYYLITILFQKLLEKNLMLLTFLVVFLYLSTSDRDTFIFGYLNLFNDLSLFHYWRKTTLLLLLFLNNCQLCFRLMHILPSYVQDKLFILINHVDFHLIKLLYSYSDLRDIDDVFIFRASDLLYFLLQFRLFLVISFV